jgi:hypothetical protein
MPPPTLSLDETLAQFRSKVNGDSRLISILHGWEPVIAVEVLDTGWKRYLQVRNCRIEDIRPDITDDAHMVHLLASEDVLAAVFDGRFNPTEAFLDGELQIFASDKDQIKLDAISLILWGA